MFGIENTLRAFICTYLEAVSGPCWYKDRLPGDLLEKYRASVKLERAVHWVSLTPHHPLFYLDFPDLRKIIERKDNWVGGFDQYFDKNKQIFLGHLSALEPIRNSIAHNRYLQQSDILRLKNFRAMVQDCLEHSARPLRCDFHGPASLLEQFKKIGNEAASCFAKMSTLKELPAVPEWEKSHSCWWFDTDYVGRDISAISQFYAAVSQYRQIPRTHGSGYLIEKWITAERISELYQKCHANIQLIIGDTLEPRDDHDQSVRLR